ncbi:MAG: class I SAM-dependent methyltransferase [Patescibacteria group bacterium]|nr:class I SAM-dependent methyltransferase [Patescibacteria group bacterium]
MSIEHIKSFKSEAPEQQDAEEYEIPSTAFSLEEYIIRLWSLQWLGEKGIEAEKITEEVLYKEIQERFNELVATLAGNKGYILDLGAGESPVMIELNKALEYYQEDHNMAIQPKGIRLDFKYEPLLQTRLKEFVRDWQASGFSKKQIDEVLTASGKKSRAVVADVLSLPFRNTTFQLVVSNELIPYFLEERESEAHKIYLRYRQLGWEKCLLELEKEKEKDGLSAEFDSQKLEDMKREVEKYHSILKDKFKYKPAYDLEMFEKFFNEISRVLISGGEARIFPFDIGYLKGTEQDEAGRVIKFQQIIENNFRSSMIYLLTKKIRGLPHESGTLVLRK